MSVPVSLLSLLLSTALVQDLPPLPKGLSGDSDKEQKQEQEKSASSPSGLPSLPTGLGKTDEKDKPVQDKALPSLPSGLGSAPSSTDTPDAEKSAPNWFMEHFTGFVEARGGIRLQEDETQDGASIGEIRTQLQTELSAGPALFNLTADFLFDPVANDYAIDLEKGRGFIDLREANMVLRPSDFLDLKIGRQIATWGTGDLVFINDMFPKDYNSFFIGRDDEYLKAPSDAIRASFFSDIVNVDLVYTPRFDADRYIDGTRISYLNPLTGMIAGEDMVIDPVRPDGWFDDDEIAIRFSRNAGTFELAAYTYDGYWKSPAGFNTQGRFIFPELAVYGASIRGPFLGGIGNAEVGYYDSKDDPDGDNPFLPNSQARFLVGYEREAMTNLTIGLQYYTEQTLDHDALAAALPMGAEEPDEIRHVITTRLTKLAYNQNLTLSLFIFYSPNQEDGYLRARASYKLDDNWLVDGGVNVFYGEPQAFFGQFEDNTNIYAGLRRSF
ncbi:hypothetical protein [Parvularcula marina]|uniref:DUF1302 domain-containing protein n=1 Tax=Parvularcula marina TaxID=2292771 RepID=A0A371REL2_9PROT|nr:hypothetical protein [Parvularcula marina]RFB03901.1 hypothetical protein DX908_00535 [Parvularcula marina]